MGFKNTAIQALIILATTLFFCPLAGYGFAKFQFPGKRFLFGLMEMNALGWLNTYQALVLPLVISSLGIFWMHGVIAGIPDELLHAARDPGCMLAGVPAHAARFPGHAAAVRSRHAG